MLLLAPSPTFANHLTVWLQPSSESNKDIYPLNFQWNVVQGCKVE